MSAPQLDFGFPPPVPALPLRFFPARSHETADRPWDLSCTDKIARATQAIRRIFEAGRPGAIGWSAGKDSTVLASLVLTTAIEFRAAKGELPPIIITHSNTGIENPAYQQVVDAERRRMQAFIERHRLPARIDIAGPLLNDSWAVAHLSGRALPTFARSSHRRCSIDFKVKPQARQRAAALAELGAIGEPVLMVGTRFGESASRARRMRDRGESDIEPQVTEFRSESTGRVLRREWHLSPIAWWDETDVWTYLNMLFEGEIESYTDTAAIREAYRAGGGNQCVALADESLSANAKACGARFGCALCTAVGRDKSLEAMIEDDRAYAYLRRLNHLQRHIVQTQGDNSRRNWLGRTIDSEGFIVIQPDTYSAAMTRELLAYCLSIQQDERESAAELGIAPRFELVSERQLIAIDAIWSLQAYQPRPFEALAIWDRIVNGGERHYPPEYLDNEPVRIELRPAPRYLYAGNWEDDPLAILNHAYGPMFDPVAFAAGVGEAREQALERARLEIKLRREVGQRISQEREEAIRAQSIAAAGGCIGFRTLDSGSVVADVTASEIFDIDEEGAALFLAFEARDHLDRHHHDGADPLIAYRTFVQYGFLATSSGHLSVIDEMMRRAAWKIRHGLHRMDTAEILALSVSKSERAAGRRSPVGKPTLCERHHDSAGYQRARRYAAILSRREPTSSGEVQPAAA